MTVGDIPELWQVIEPVQHTSAKTRENPST